MQVDYLEQRLNYAVYLHVRLKAPPAVVDSASGVEVSDESPPLINRSQRRLGSRSGSTQPSDYFSIVEILQ